MRPRNWLLLALLAALSVAGLLGLHAVRHVVRMSRAHGELRPWMSVPYIARTHHVPPAILYKAIGLPEDRRDRRAIGRIARQQGRQPSELIREIQKAIARGSP